MAETTSIEVHTYNGKVQVYPAHQLIFMNRDNPKLINNSGYLLAEWDEKVKQWVKPKFIERVKLHGDKT